MKQLWPEHWRIELHFKYFFLFIFFFTGCDIFLTRPADNPSTNQSINPPATTPEQLIENFKNAISKKDPKEYLVFFSDTVTANKNFIFTPHQKVYLQFASIFSAWNKNYEEQYFTTVKTAMNPSANPFLIFENSQLIKFQSDSALFTTDYKLFLPHTNQNIITEFKGRSHFYFINSKTKNWVCYRWDDFETAKDSSWSLCKGFFSK